jgi:hypothetical protein
MAWGSMGISHHQPPYDRGGDHQEGRSVGGLSHLIGPRSYAHAMEPGASGGGASVQPLGGWRLAI